MKKISIVIPTYNSALTIKKTLKSIFDQTYKNLYEEAEILKENKKLKDSNMLLCNIIDAPHTPDNIKIKSIE